MRARGSISVEAVLRKRFWIVVLPLVAIAAFLNAQAVGELVGTRLALDASQLARAALPARPAAIAPPARAPNAEPILRRNPFDHVTGSLVAPPVESADGATDDSIATSDPVNAPKCDGVGVTVIAASSDEDWSFAALSGPDNKSHLLRRGGEIAGKKVYFVGRDRVWLSSDGALCQVGLHDPKAAPAAPATPPVASTTPPASRSRGAAPLDPDLRKGIQAVSATEFNIDRGVVDKILENQATLMRQARVVPVQENGRVVGVRLNGIKPDALLGVLGMQNGDQLRSINGFEMGSPEKALEAYARLRTADHLTIQLNRGGKNINLDYNIK